MKKNVLKYLVLDKKARISLSLRASIIKLCVCVSAIDVLLYIITSIDLLPNPVPVLFLDWICALFFLSFFLSFAVYVHINVLLFLFLFSANQTSTHFRCFVFHR